MPAGHKSAQCRHLVVVLGAFRHIAPTHYSVMGEISASSAVRPGWDSRGGFLRSEPHALRGSLGVDGGEIVSYLPCTI